MHVPSTFALRLEVLFMNQSNVIKETNALSDNVILNKDVSIPVLFVMTKMLVPLIAVLMETACLLQSLAHLISHVLSLHVTHKLENAPTLLKFVMMVMHVPLILVMSTLENVSLNQNNALMQTDVLLKNAILN